MVRIRALLHGGGERRRRPAHGGLCGAAGTAPRRRRVREHALHDGLQWRRAVGRAHVARTHSADRIGAGGRLHRRRRLWRGARHSEPDRLRHGRHHGEMRGHPGRRVRAELALFRRRVRHRLPDPGFGGRHRRGRRRRRLDRLGRRRRAAPHRAEERGVRSRPGRLRPRRHRAHGDRRQPGARADRRRGVPGRRARARPRRRFRGDPGTRGRPDRHG